MLKSICELRKGTAIGQCHHGAVALFANAGHAPGLVRQVFTTLRKLVEIHRLHHLTQHTVGQMIDDVRIAVAGRMPVYHIGNTAAGPMNTGNIIDALRAYAEGVAK